MQHLTASAAVMSFGAMCSVASHVSLAAALGCADAAVATTTTTSITTATITPVRPVVFA